MKPEIGDTVKLPYLSGHRDARLIVTCIADDPMPHPGIPGSPLVYYAHGLHKRSKRQFAFCVYADTFECIQA